MNPLISVIVPVYKAEPYLEECLLSIANQTYQELEAILIDDGSPDRCGDICEQYAMQDKRFRVVHQLNQGVSAARNRGVELASGDWLTFTDADDWLEPDMLKRLLDSAFMQDGIAMAVGNTYKNYASAQIRLMQGGGAFVIQNQNEMMAAVLSGSGLEGADMRGPCGKLYSHSVIKNNAIRFDPRLAYGEDMIFNLQVLSHIDKIVVNKDAYYHYRINTSSVCRSFSPHTLPRTDRLVQQCDALISDTPYLYSAHQSGIVRLIMADCDGYFFHPHNPASLGYRLAQFNEFLSREPYSAAVANRNNPYLTKKQRMIAYLAQRRWLTPLWLLYQSRGLWSRLRRQVNKPEPQPSFVTRRVQGVRE